MLGWGSPARWTYGTTPDFTRILAMIAAVLILRFVIGLRLTVLSFTLALLAGALWAFAAELWGLALPTLAALLVMAALSVSVRRARTP